MERLIEVNGISAGYGNRQVLWNVNLFVSEGERVLLMGPNGSGKSTLLKVIVGVVKPYSGRVIFDGVDITKISTSKRINMGINYLPQTRNIFPGLTVEENFHLACFYCEDKYFLERLNWILGIFPFLKDRLSSRAGLLSGGQRQALGLGMALMKKAKLLIVDEPTAGLSPKAASDILKGIEKAQDEEKFTILMVEHNLRYLSGWFNRALIMREGRVILEESDTSKFLNRKLLESIFFDDV